MILSYIYIILGILFIIYTIALGLGAHGSMFFLIWAVAGVLCITVGILRLCGFSLPKIPLLIIRITVFALLILFMVVEALILSYFGNDTDETVDYLIVAGAQVYTDSPSPVLKFRLDKAVEYLEAHPSVKCIVTGGQGTNEPRPEADVMAEYLVRNGISAERIIKRISP